MVVVASLTLGGILLAWSQQLVRHHPPPRCNIVVNEGFELSSDYTYRLSDTTVEAPSPNLKVLDDQLALGRDHSQLPPCLTAPLRWEP